MSEQSKFDPILAENFSLMIHSLCGQCPHDIGITLAVMAHSFYMKEEIGVEVDNGKKTCM
jgi:hypothetical protein